MKAYMDIRVFGRDETGTVCTFDWTCPKCGWENGGSFFDADLEEGEGFKIDEKCEWCDEEVTVVCEEGGYYNL